MRAGTISRMRDRQAAAFDGISPLVIEDAAQIAGRLREELARAIIGQRSVVGEILIAFVAGGHCLLRGVPGLAKTLLIKTLARAFDLKVQSHSVHARPHAVRHHRHRSHRRGAGNRTP